MSETMGVLGPKGTQSEAAASYLNEQLPQRCELVTVPDLFACLQDVEEGRLDTALVPVENSLEGAINITLDTLARSESLEVMRELIWPVHNQLMAKCDGAAIKRIFSHPQPISQCRAYLQQHYPQAEIVKVASTARAAELVAAAPNCFLAISLSVSKNRFHGEASSKELITFPKHHAASPYIQINDPCHRS